MENFDIQTSSLKTYTVISGIVMLLIASIWLAINFFIFKYPGINYLPSVFLQAVISLPVVILGLQLLFDKQHFSVLLTKEILFYFFTLSCLAILTNAAQYTPFQPIDYSIITLENKIDIDMHSLMAWTATMPWFKDILLFSYDSLSYQLLIIPILLIISGRISDLRELYCLLLISGIIGFSIYYFFPTTAPASILHSPFFTQSQLDTGIKFREIHQHINPSTEDGGMISFPSFHVIWAWYCLYVLRYWKLLFYMVLPLTLLLIVSCVLLGWHYPTDIVGSFIVILFTQLLVSQAKKGRNVSTPVLQ
jgi:hypothetical protein